MLIRVNRLLWVPVGYQDGVSLVAVLAWEGRVDRQADAVPDDGGENEEVKGLPLDERYAVFPDDDNIKLTRSALAEFRP